MGKQIENLFKSRGKKLSSSLSLQFTVNVTSISMNTLFKSKTCLAQASEKTQQTPAQGS